MVPAERSELSALEGLSNSGAARERVHKPTVLVMLTVLHMAAAAWGPAREERLQAGSIQRSPHLRLQR